MIHDPIRDFLKFLALQLVLAWSMLFTMVWVNAYTYGHSVTIHIDLWGEALIEGLVLFGVFWPVVTVGLYLLAVDANLSLVRERTPDDVELP